MKTEMTISVVLYLAVLCLLSAALARSSLSGQSFFMMFAAAIGFYHLFRDSRGFAVDSALLVKSIWFGVIVAIPASVHVLPMLSDELIG